MNLDVPSTETSHARLPNYIVFGAMGAGKSSLINLIAGKECAKSSPDATSCTLESTKYEIELPDLHFNIFDTVSKYSYLRTHVLTKTLFRWA
jgi:ABC-type molybdenum transport system ATPase subunit/photorepair protein PhrA